MIKLENILFGYFWIKANFRKALQPFAGLIAQKNALCQITLSEDEAFPPRYHFCYRIVPVSLSCLPHMHPGHPVNTAV